MKKLTSNQKNVIHGGGAIAAIATGTFYLVSTAISAIPVVKTLYPNLFTKEESKVPEQEIAPETKSFSNLIRSEIVIHS